MNDGYNHFTEDENDLAINKLSWKSSPGPDSFSSRLHKIFSVDFCSVLA